jgi:DNA-binding transcriptional regulator YdaS (Cro superfamily)
MFEGVQQKAANAIGQMQARLNQNVNSLRNEITSVRKVTKANQSIVDMLNRLNKK